MCWRRKNCVQKVFVFGCGNKMELHLLNAKCFERMEEQNTNFMLEFQEGLMSEEDWLTMGSLHDFLENFYAITLLFQSQNMSLLTLNFMK